MINDTLRQEADTKRQQTLRELVRVFLEKYKEIYHHHEKRPRLETRIRSAIAWDLTDKVHTFHRKMRELEGDLNEDKLVQCCREGLVFSLFENDDSDVTQNFSDAVLMLEAIEWDVEQLQTVYVLVPKPTGDNLDELNEHYQQELCRIIDEQHQDEAVTLEMLEQRRDQFARELIENTADMVRYVDLFLRAKPFVKDAYLHAMSATLTEVIILMDLWMHAVHAVILRKALIE